MACDFRQSRAQILLLISDKSDNCDFDPIWQKSSKKWAHLAILTDRFGWPVYKIAS